MRKLVLLSIFLWGWINSSSQIGKIYFEKTRSHDQKEIIYFYNDSTFAFFHFQSIAYCLLGLHESYKYSMQCDTIKSDLFKKAIIKNNRIIVYPNYPNKRNRIVYKEGIWTSSLKNCLDSYDIVIHDKNEP